MMGTEENKGIIPQLNEDLWNRIGANLASNTNEDIQKKFFVTISFLEVYNEEIKDLLNPSDKKLKIHESPVEGIYIDNLSEIIVKDSHEVMKLIYQGNAIRHVGATLMNDQSSRSHSVFIIKVEQRISTKLSSGMQREQLIKAKLNLVDLAGSERVAKTQASGQTLKEGANINKSLLTLGNVINALAEGANKPGKKKVIPYRESKLTRLLQESLGGNSGTVMIASISPADYNYVETLSTLKYANRAKSIENAVVKNEDMSEKLIKDLQQEIEMLKKQLKEGGGGGDSTYEEELRLKLNEMKLHNDNIWEEKEKLSLELQSIRENNMNVLFSQIIPNMKNAKVTHMKNIKRLSNEKVLLLKNYKELKDDVSNLKSELDSNINSYQKLQVEFDENNRKSIENLEDEKEKEEKAQEYANQMIPLLQEIETKRPIYIEKKENLNRIKDRLKKIEEELIDERAELVSTSALLEQDDHIREQIQQEEREKLKKEIEEQIEIEKKNLKKDYLNEFEAQIENLTAELKLSKSLIEFEKSKAENLEEKFLNLKKYSEEVEEKLVDSEYEKEYYNEENEKKKKLLIELEEEKNKLLDDKNNLIKENVSFIFKMYILLNLKKNKTLKYFIIILLLIFPISSFRLTFKKKLKD